MDSKKVVLEVNLSGSNLIIGMPSMYKDHIKDLFSDTGANHFSEPGKYDDGSLQKSIKNYLERGRNFVIIDKAAKLESQPPKGEGSKSMVFGYHTSKTGHRQVYLSLKGTDNIGSYREAKKVGFKDVRSIMNDKGVSEFYPSSNTPVDQLSNFKQYAASGGVVQPVPVKKNEDTWTKFPNKQKFRPNVEKTQLVGDMSPPMCDWIFLKNFPLKFIEDMFVIPDYQRRVDAKKVSDVVLAVKEERFSDNLLRTMTMKEGKMLANDASKLTENILFYDFEANENKCLDTVWEIADGQHKTHAFLYLREFEKLKKYDFMIQNFHSEYRGREIFSNLNSGKPAGPDDRIKALKNDEIVFFKETKGLLSAYNGPKEISFGKMIRAQKYAITGNRSIKQKDVETFVTEISKDDTDKMKAFLILTGSVWGVDNKKNVMYRNQYFWNAYKVFFERDVDEGGLKTMLKTFSSDKDLKKLNGQSNESYANIYNRMSKLADDLLEIKTEK